MAKKMITVRVEESVIADLKQIAGHEGMLYQTYLQKVLFDHVRNKKIEIRRQSIKEKSLGLRSC